MNISKDWSDLEKKTNEESLGCSHYRRKCALISPCCGKEYTCRLCHDDVEPHTLNRYKVEKVKCLKCKQVQKVQKSCEKCASVFGNYFCDICRLFDDVDRKQFHCDPCGLCRVGGREKFFHCTKCDMCLSLDIKESHKCIEKVSRNNCPVCMEDLHTSTIPIHVPECAHILHVQCYKDLLKNGKYACPTCNVSMVDMSDVWRNLDDEIRNTPMPEEYRDKQMHVLCRDCHKTSMALFHVIGMKCGECGSYNTAGADEPSEGAGPTEGTRPSDGARPAPEDRPRSPQIRPPRSPSLD